MIPDEAVEAVARRNFAAVGDFVDYEWAEVPATLREGLLSEARKQCEAAAPFIAAEAFHRGYVAALDQAADNLDTLWYERKDRMYEQRDWADGVEESEALVKKMAADSHKEGDAS